jgi:hypothetical protein
MIRSQPRRLAPPEPLGSLLKRPSVPTTTARSSGHGDADYLGLVRQLPCLYCGVEPCGEAAHIKFSSSRFGKTNSLGKRPHDRDALPLCRDDHLNARHAQHKGGEEAFWDALGISPYLVAKRLYAQRGDLVAMRAVIMVAISERNKR